MGGSGRSSLLSIKRQQIVRIYDGVVLCCCECSPPAPASDQHTLPLIDGFIRGPVWSGRRNSLGADCSSTTHSNLSKGQRCDPFSPTELVPIGCCCMHELCCWAPCCIPPLQMPSTTLSVLSSTNLSSMPARAYLILLLHIGGIRCERNRFALVLSGTCTVA